MGATLASAFLFAVMALWAKMVAPHVPSTEVVFFRSLLPALWLAPHLWRVPRALWQRRGGLLALRGVLGGVAMLLYFLALERVPLSDASMLCNTAPVFAGLVAGLVLGEPFSPRLRLVLPVTLVGVVLICEPACLFGTSGGDGLGYLAGLLSGVFSGLAYTAVRKLTTECTPQLVVGVFSIISASMAVPFMAVSFHRPGLFDAVLLVGVGLSAMAAQILMTVGYAQLPVGRASTLGLTSTLFAALLGVLLLHESMDAWQISGMGLVFVSMAWLTAER
jgi:drug/metabolite transporter (DMT)-like permease